MEVSSELKLCPFCGGEGKMIYGRLFDNATPTWHVQCQNEAAHRSSAGCYDGAPGSNENSHLCDRCFSEKTTCKFAVDNWNTRKDSDHLKEKILDLLVLINDLTEEIDWTGTGSYEDGMADKKRLQLRVQTIMRG